jgi:hypothetical protein
LLCGLRVPGCLPHPTDNATFGDVETDHLQFAMWTERILGWRNKLRLDEKPKRT